MAEFTFFRQLRNDGGVRTGIELDGEYCWESFIEGSGDDPTLLWYLDVRGLGHGVPADELAVRDWLREHAEVIRQGLRDLADRLAAGFDSDHWPVSWPIATSLPDVELSVVISTVRRVDALNVANMLRELADSWEQTLDGMEGVSPVVH